MLRLCVLVVLVSAIVNDTPLVAMMIPIVLKWATANGLPADWLLLPLSYSALLGGVVTLIGSSTNLVLADLMLADRAQGHDPGFQLEFFSTTPVALPVALIGVAYLALRSPCCSPVMFRGLPGHVGCQHPGTPAAAVGGVALSMRGKAEMIWAINPGYITCGVLESVACGQRVAFGRVGPSITIRHHSLRLGSGVLGIKCDADPLSDGTISSLRQLRQRRCRR